MSRPAGSTIVKWAKDALYTSGVDNGLATKLEPTSGERGQGYTRGNRPPARKFNWLLNALGRWVDYLADVPLINWQHLVTEDDAAAAVTLTQFRQDSTVGLFYNPAGCFWVVTGHDDAGKFYIVDSGVFEEYDTGLASPSRFMTGTWSTITGGLYMLFTGAWATARPEIHRSNSTMGTWTKTVFAGPAVITDSTAQDVITTSTGRMLVCGRLDSNMAIWGSDNHTSFAYTVVGAVITDKPLRRLCAGRNPDGTAERIFAWISREDGTDGGNRFWYSDNDGTSWSVSGSLTAGAQPIEDIVDMVYLAEHQVFLIALGTEGIIYRCTDPTDTGTYTSVLNITTVDRMAASTGAVVVCGVDPNAPNRLISYSVDAGTTWHTVGRARGEVIGFACSEFVAGGAAALSASENVGQFGYVGENGSEHVARFSLGATGRLAR